MFSAKTLLWAFTYIWVRWTISRFKYNQVMKLGWKRMLPISIIDFIVLAVLIYSWHHYID